MPKIVCAAIDCAYNGDNNRCTARNINLSDGYWHTMREGLRHFQICKKYEKIERTKQIEKELMKLIFERNSKRDEFQSESCGENVY